MMKILLICLFALLLSAHTVSSEEINSDVIIIVDTSISMKNAGMDPNRASLLVSKLLSDVIPEGRLSYVRLLDLATDKELLPSKETGITGSCSENTAATCNRVEADGDWKSMSYNNSYGVLERPSRGDEGFKIRLDSHLEQVSNNSYFYLSFSAARGWLAKGKKENNKYIIWLSDGKAEAEQEFKEQVRLAKSEGIQIESIIFGAGETAIAKAANIPVTTVNKPIDLMQAFADIFRKIVNAPYDVDNTIASSPDFDMLDNIKEAWIVVYGDDTLAQVSLLKPDGTRVLVNYAEDKQKNAGAYRVVYIQNPDAGKWKVVVNGGGSDVAYAVVQNSSMFPFLDSPKEAFLGVETNLVASIKAGGANNKITDKAILDKSTITAEVEGNKYVLNDKGNDGDKQAGDGLYSGKIIFNKKGANEVKLTLKNNFTNRSKLYTVMADGYFSYKGKINPEINFGKLLNGNEVCRSVEITDAEQKGIVKFESDTLTSLPNGHQLTAFSKKNKAEFKLSPHEAFDVCLTVDERAPSSIMKSEPLLVIKVAGSSAKDQQVIFKVSWDVEGLSFWERWWWLFLIIAGIILAIIIAFGFILPKRFQHTLHIAMGADEEELEEFVPMQLNKMPKVGIGFYRNAQAFVFDDFRVSGKGKGASVKIKAQKFENVIQAINGRVLYRKNIQQEWEKVENGIVLRSGEMLRVGDAGLHFKLLDK